MSTPKHLTTLSLPAFGGIAETAFIRFEHCSVTAKPLVYGQNLSSHEYKAQQEMGCYGESELHPSQTQYSGVQGSLPTCIIL